MVNLLLRTICFQNKFLKIVFITKFTKYIFEIRKQSLNHEVLVTQVSGVHTRNILRGLHIGYNLLYQYKPEHQ